MSRSAITSRSVRRAVPRFLQRFEEVYGRLGKTETILAAAAAHHRLALDSPVSRRQWPRRPPDVARDAAGRTRHGGRLVDRPRPCPQCRCLQDAPCRLRPAAPQRSRRPRQPERRELSRNSRGSSSTACIDQVTFMERLMQPDRLRARILLWAEEEITARSSAAEIRQQSLKPCSIAASSRAATPPISSAPASARPAALSRRF